MRAAFLISSITAAVISVTAAAAQDKASSKFLGEAIQGNFAEVAMGELAQKNAQGQEVKAYGQMLITDHGDANKRAMEAARGMGINPPAGPSAKQKADHDKMANMTGTAFDRAFAQHMVMDHKKDIAAYQKASKKRDAAGQYAQSTLPTLRKHLENAQSLQKQTTVRR
jgi:putative membrane protein